MSIEASYTFKKCDLHVHSSSCESRSYSQCDFVSTVLNSDLDVVAITDHNMIDVELVDDLSSRMKKKGKQLLAGVELNIHFDPDMIKENSLELSGESNYFHGIVWCDAIDAPNLQKAIFSLLEGIGIHSGQLENKTAKEISALSKGKSFSFTEIQNRLQSIKYFFTFHESKGDKRRNLSGYLKNGNPHNERFKDSLFYYNQKLAVEGGKKSRKITDWFEENLDSTVSCFFCSDAKTLAEIGTCFTWIDFDGSLDSLNLAITDPQSRIVTSDTSSEIPQKNLSNYLKAIKFNLLDESGDYVECELTFAPSYNGIIGSRGSGKSMLAKILSGGIDDTYNKYVNPDSIRFQMEGSAFTQNAPRCLYLSQGELGDVFDKASYKSVPFLNTRLEKMRLAATEASDEHFKRIESYLSQEKTLILSFLEKYGNGLKRPDALLNERPSGFAITAPPKISAREDEYKLASQQLDEAYDSIKLAIDTIKAIKLSEAFPEKEAISRALGHHLKQQIGSLNSTLKDIALVRKALDKLELQPFVARKELIDAFSNILESSNREKALSFHTYNASIKGARTFLDDLLELNINISTIENHIRDAVANMLSPISSETYQADTDTVEIGLSFSETNSFEEAIAHQFKNLHEPIPPIVSVCLCWLSNKNPKTILNGNKFRNANDIDQIIDRYFDNIRDDLSKNKEMEIDISFNEKSMREMSPGMQAQALLKLLLSDSLINEDYDYVVLDQPEDNLDTPTISEVLVDRIKKLKKKVQFFVISHSAPVIINGDARIVVVAEAGKSSLAYKTGAINGKDTKTTIAEVLDGGERYLKMRLYKYDFQLDERRGKDDD